MPACLEPSADAIFVTLLCALAMLWRMTVMQYLDICAQHIMAFTVRRR